MTTPEYVKYFIDEEIVETSRKKRITVIELKPEDEEEAVIEWASHLRSHYTTDDDLEKMSEYTKLTKEKILSDIIFPDPNNKFGKSIMVGDFAEILIADYLQFVNDYVVPRTRYEHKDKRNSSTQGSDLLAYKISDPSKWSNEDELLVYEVKAQSSERKVSSPRLQDAINDSAKDNTRLAESIVASGRRLIGLQKDEEARMVFRFLNSTDEPYKKKYGAAAVHSKASFSRQLLEDIDTSKHPDDEIELLVVHCEQLLNFILYMYERAGKC